MSTTAEFLEIIANMEAELARMKAAVGGKGITLNIKAAPVKEKKEPNVWIKFSQRVSTLLKEADIKTGAATVSKQFASSLKDQKGYDKWTDEDILAAWPTWTKPAESKMAAAKREASSDEGSVKSAKASKAEPKAESKASKAEPKAEPKEESKAPRKPQSEESKAAAKAKRAATLAAKKEAAKPEEAAEEVKPSKPAKPAKKPTYTLKQLGDFGQQEYEDEMYGINVRGDVADKDGKYVGRWDDETKTIVKAETPADWDDIQMAGSDSE